MTSPDAASVARRYALGERPSLRGPVARGELGEVWRLETASGTFAVKQVFEPVSESDARPAAAFQDAAVAAGVPAPAVVRSVAGDVLTEIGGQVLRMYSWVDVAAQDLGLTRWDRARGPT